jgi:hypothetical protein
VGERRIKDVYVTVKLHVCLQQQRCGEKAKRERKKKEYQKHAVFFISRALSSFISFQFSSVDVQAPASMIVLLHKIIC